MDDNTQKLHALIQSHRNLIRSILHRNYRDGCQVSADDIEQEVYIRLLQVIKSEREITQTTSYIAKVVNSTILDVIRKASRRLPEGQNPDEIDPETQIKHEPEGHLAQQELITQISLLVDQLPQNRATAVRLHLQGYSSQDIASLCGWTEAKARNLSSRGMQALKQSLNDAGITYED